MDIKHLFKNHALQNIPLNFEEAYDLGCYTMQGMQRQYAGAGPKHCGLVRTAQHGHVYLAHGPWKPNVSMGTGFRGMPLSKG